MEENPYRSPLESSGDEAGCLIWLIPVPFGCLGWLVMSVTNYAAAGGLLGIAFGFLVAGRVNERRQNGSPNRP